jgi:predicted nucleic acid-binding protein
VLPGVVLDANVLFPASLRDILLRCAEKELYRLYISEQIWEEVVRNLVATGRMTAQQIARLDSAIRAFLVGVDAFVVGHEGLISTLANHPKDRHVLAVAVHAHAQTIVTFNLKDYPASALQPLSVVAVHPDTFLCHLHDLTPTLIRQIVHEQAADLSNPPLTVDDVLVTLTQHVPAFISLLRTSQELSP